MRKLYQLCQDEDLRIGAGPVSRFIIGKTAKEEPWAIIGGIGGAVAVVLISSVILAVIKLRRRDLSAILEGSGWAINARMRLTRTQSRYFTQRPAYPLNAKGVRNRRWWIFLVIILAILAGAFAFLRNYL